MVKQKCAIGIKGLHNIVECKEAICGLYSETRLCDQSVEVKITALEQENERLKIELKIAEKIFVETVSEKSKEIGELMAKITFMEAGK